MSEFLAIAHQWIEFSKWILLLGAASVLCACAPTRTVYIPPEWQTAPKISTPEQTPEQKVERPATQQPVVQPAPQFKEQDVTDTSGQPTSPASSEPPPTNQTRASDPQYLASMHLVDQAKASLALGDADNAIPPLEQAIQVDVYNGHAFLELARAWKMKGSQSKAIEFANKAEILFQDNPSDLKKVYLFKADLFKELNDPDKADFYLQKAARL